MITYSTKILQTLIRSQGHSIFFVDQECFPVNFSRDTSQFHAILAFYHCPGDNKLVYNTRFNKIASAVI
jgi:hypothetical protein